MDAPSNGQDCDPSDNDDGRANTISGEANPSSSSGGQGFGEVRLEPSRPRASQDLFGYLAPLPFGPAFSHADAANLTPHCSPGGWVYAVNHRSSTITKYTLCPLARSTVITVGSNPLQVALTPDGKTLLVTRYDNAVVFVDTRTDSVIATLNTGILYPNGIAISPDGTRAYVTSYDDASARVFVIDIASRTIVGSVTTPAFPKSVFLTPDGSQLWLLSYKSSIVAVIDTLSLTVSSQINVGGQADIGMAFNPSGTRAYIGVGPDQLLVLDTATLDEVTSITMGWLPSDVAVTPDGSRVIVNSWGDGSLAVVDAATNKVLKSSGASGGFSMGLTLFQ